MKEIYTNFRKYAYTWVRKLIKELKTPGISTTPFDKVAFVFFHVMETFSEDFLEVHVLRSLGFQLLLHELQQRCARNFENKCNYICWITQEIVKDENVINLLLGLDFKQSVSRGQNTTLYNRIFIYNLCGIGKLQSTN